MLLLSLTVMPPGVPETVAVFGTTEGAQSAVAVVFREQAYVQVSPGSSVDGVSSGPTASALSTRTGGSSHVGSVTWTEPAGKARSPGFVTTSV